MKQLKLFFDDKTVKSILDVGTGSGKFIAVLKEAIPGARITGIDPDMIALKEAAQKYPAAEFVEMTGGKLSFDDNMFDAASISMALHHLPDIQQTLSEMKRVVKPGGWLIINELFCDNLTPAQEVHKMMHHLKSKIDRLNGICHNETFTRAEIIEIVKKSGVEISLNFNNNKDRSENTTAEIEKRKENLEKMLEEIKGLPQYSEFKKQIPVIYKALDEHGFQLAERVLIVAKIRNNTNLNSN